MYRSALLALGLALAGLCLTRAGELPTARPETLGLSTGKLAELSPALQKLADDGKIAGGVALVARRGSVAYTTTFGVRDLQSKTPMTEDTIFAIASMTKPITCVAVMILVEQGKLGLDDPVGKYLPELKDMRVLGDPKDDTETAIATVPAVRPITVRHLLAHTSGFSYGTPAEPRLNRSYSQARVQRGMTGDLKTIAEEVERLGKVALAHQPGEGWTYGLSHDVLGRLIEVVSGRSFDRYLEEHVFQPLNMHDTSFLIPEPKRDRVATTYRAGTGTGTGGGDDAGLTPLPKNYGSATYFSGGGGLFSTARDYSRFAQMLLAGGALEGRRLVRPETISAMTTNQIGELSTSIPGVASLRGLKYGLGFGLEMTAGTGSAPPTLVRYFWGGAFSTHFWVDPRHEIVAIVLTQITPFNHSGAGDVFRQGVDAAIEDH